LEEGTEAIAVAINNNGLVVGMSSTDGLLGSSVFTYTSEQGMIGLGDFGGSVVVFDVNDSGVIVGYTQSNGAASAWEYSDGVKTDLLGLGGTYSYATAINAAGTIVGSASLGTSLSSLRAV